MNKEPKHTTNNILLTKARNIEINDFCIHIY